MNPPNISSMNKTWKKHAMVCAIKMASLYGLIDNKHCYGGSPDAGMAGIGLNISPRLGARHQKHMRGPNAAAIRCGCCLSQNGYGTNRPMQCANANATASSSPCFLDLEKLAKMSCVLFFSSTYARKPLARPIKCQPAHASLSLGADR